MTITTNGKFCRLLSYPLAGLSRCELIYVNWDMLIGIDEHDKTQYWHGFAGNQKSGIRAVFYNIYGLMNLYRGGNITKQGAAK